MRVWCLVSLCGKERIHKHTTLNTRDEMSTTLNPLAPAFVPTCYIVTDDDEARLIDDAMACFHHLATVNDTETLGAVSQWMNDDMNMGDSDGSDDLDDATAHFCDQEDQLRDQLHRPPRQPQGNTRGRARKRM